MTTMPASSAAGRGATSTSTASTSSSNSSPLAADGVVDPKA